MRYKIIATSGFDLENTLLFEWLSAEDPEIKLSVKKLWEIIKIKAPLDENFKKEILNVDLWCKNVSEGGIESILTKKFPKSLENLKSILLPKQTINVLEIIRTYDSAMSVKFDTGREKETQRKRAGWQLNEFSGAFQLWCGMLKLIHSKTGEGVEKRLQGLQ